MRCRSIITLTRKRPKPRNALCFVGLVVTVYKYTSTNRKPLKPVRLQQCTATLLDMCRKIHKILRHGVGRYIHTDTYIVPTCIYLPTSREFNNSGGSCRTFIRNRNRRHAIEIGAEIPRVISDERLMDVQYYYILCMEELLTVRRRQDCIDDKLIYTIRPDVVVRIIHSAL